MADEEKTTQYHVQDNSNVEDSVISAARVQYDRGNYKEALKLLLDSTTRIANSDIYVETGNCYYKLDAQKEALDYWNKAINLDPKNSKAYANIGNLYYKNNQTEMAISFWLVALISRPEDADTCLNLAVAYNTKNMRFESIKYFEKYIKYSESRLTDEYLKVKNNIQHCRDVANQYLTLGVNFQSENENKEAAACYFKSLANYPNFSKTNLNLGSIFFSDKNLDLAVKYWTAAAHIDPNYDKIYSNLAISYDLMEQFDYAYCYYYRYSNYIISNKPEYDKINSRLKKIKPFLEHHPELIKRHLDRAQEYLANNQIYEAIDEFKNYSILCPEEQKKYKSTIEKLESYINPEKIIIANYFEIGNDLINEGKYSEAKPYFTRIMKLSSPQYLEFSKARAKQSQCEKAEHNSNA